PPHHSHLSPQPPLTTTLTTATSHHNHPSPQSSLTTATPHHSHLSPQPPLTTATSHHSLTLSASSSVASSGAGVVAGGGGTKGGCGRCGQAFSIFFNKRVQCGGGCGLPVCRKCAPWSTAAQTYVCGVCSTQQPQSTTHAATTTPKTPDDAHLRQVEDSVRSHIEALVESQVGGPLDQVTAAPSTTQPHQRSLFSRHHGALSQAIAHLSYSLQMSILNRPLPTEDLPTSRHTQLSDQLTHAIKDAMILPRQTPVEDFNSHTYEDILATAILNKVLESCEGGRPNEVTIEVSHDVTSTDTDSGMSGGAKESRRGRHKRSEVSEAGSEGSEERSLTPPRHPAHRPTTISPDQGVVTDDCWANAVTTEGAPLQFKIEEHVEEITTHHLTDDDQDLEGIYDEDVSDSGGSWRGSRCSLDDSRERRHHKVSHHSVTEDPLLSTINVALPDPAHITSRRVSFPELGADIIHDSYADADECEAGPGDMVVDSETWEENWLFRRQRLVGAAGSDPVTMLIPNPEAHVPATVGNRDVDELSELSEQQSFGSGEPWSDSEGEGEAGESYQPSTASRELSTLAGEIVAEFAQQDQEYTVDYSVPSRVTTASTTQQGGGRKHSPTQPSPTQSHKSSTMPQSVHYLYTSHKEVPTGYHDGKTVEGIRNPVIVGKPRVDPDTISDSERPVPKPRKLSLATTPPSKTSMKSPLQLLPSPAEDLTILSPPLDMPHPKNVSSTSETVWFVETPEDYTVMQGRTLRLACQVNTKKPMGLSWYHNGSLVPVNHRDYWVFRRGSHHHLHVYGMTPSAAGVYAAAAYTTTHCVWVFCRVQHKANSRPQKRPTFTKGLSDITLEEGGELNLQCQVQGHPEPRVIFSRGLVKLEPSSRLAVESDQYGTWTLRLAECTLADSGEITATAFNMMSTITTRCHVRIVPEGTPIPQQDRTDTGRLKPSSSQVNKQQDPRPGGRHNRKKHNPGSYPSNTTRPTSGNLLTSAKTSSLPHRDQLTTSSGVNTDVDDLDDIQQVPTRPGITQEDVFSSTYGPTVDNEHVLSHDQTTVDEDSDLNSSVLLDGGRAYKCKVLGMDKSLEPIEYGETIDNSTTDGGNSADAYAPLFKDASASLEYLAEDISNPSSSLCEEFPNLASNGLISPSSSPCGASLGLDYYPSSHDDNPSDKEELPVIMSSVLSYSSSSTAIDQRVNIDPSVNISPLFPLTTDQLHAYTTLRDQHQEHEECPQGDKHDPACLLTASRPPTGTIADREHRKWEAAVSLPNNPYAPERLVQRLSLCHTSDHTPQPRRTLSVEFPEEGEKEEVDPSLRDGVPPKTDLNRYSRDYYVTPATGVRASSKNFKHQKSQQQQHQEPQAHQQKKQHQQQQQPGHQQQSYKTHQHLTLNGHQAVTRTSSDFSSNAQVCSQVPCKDSQAHCMSRSGDMKLKNSSPISEVSILPVTASHSCFPQPHTNNHNADVCSSSEGISDTPDSDACISNIGEGSDLVFSRIIERFNKSGGFQESKITRKSEPQRDFLSCSATDNGLNSSHSPSQTTPFQRSSYTHSSLPIRSSTPVHAPPVHHSSVTGSLQFIPFSTSTPSTTPNISPLSKLVTPVTLESPGIGELEEELIRHGFARASFRARKATKGFSLNPLFEDESKSLESQDADKKRFKSVAPQSLTSSCISDPSSDYYSSYESLPYLSSFSREGSLRLPKPQVTEESFERLPGKGGSLRLPQKKSNLKSWGSF
ncbi:Myotilin-like, partial [Homarus americanus]